MTTPYRNEREALELRLNELKQELSLAQERLREGARAQSDATRLEREIANVTAKLSKPKRSLLDAIRIASPCNADWTAMKGDDRSRFCGACEKNVYDLSKMTRAEAEALITQNEAPCVRLYKRRDGTVITADCPVGLRRRRFRRIATAAIGGGLLAAGAMLARWRANPAPVASLPPADTTSSSDIEIRAGGMMIADPPAQTATMGEPAPTTAPSTHIKPKMGALPRRLH